MALTHKQMSTIYRIIAEIIENNTNEEAIDALDELAIKREKANDYDAANMYREAIGRLQDQLVVIDNHRLETL